MKGLKFRKLDLHIHTPASLDFIKPKDIDDDEIANSIIDKAIQCDLEGIAITDHNSGEWIDKIKDAAKGKLTVFPGVEITCSGGAGIHIIALFDPTKNKNHVRDLLSKLGLSPDEHGKETAVVDKSPIDVINIISSCDALPILAHINSSHGVFVEMEGQPRIKVIQCENLIAAEGTDFFDETKKQKRKRVFDLLDGTDPSYKRKLAVYQASDNPVGENSHGHSIEGIGKRFTFFKMEEINLRSLKNCFNDPDVRIKHLIEVSDTFFPIIKRVKVNGGFLDGFEFNFHSGLNSIIGSKGTGKSLLIEFLRFALDQEPTNEILLNDHNNKLENRLRLFGEIEVDLLLDTGNIIKVKRQYNPLENNPYLLSDGQDISRLFPTLFLSQNEIIKIAEEEEEQLKFIDRFFDFREYKSRLTEIERELKALDQTFAQSIEAFIELTEIKNRKKTKELELAEIDQKLKNSIFDKFSDSETKFQNLISVNQYLKNLKEKVGISQKLFYDVPSPSFPENISKEPVFKRLLNIIDQTKVIVTQNFVDLEKELDVKMQEMKAESQEIITTHKKIKLEYETYVKKSGGNYQTLASKRQTLTKEIMQLTEKLNLLKEKSEKISTLKDQREKLLNEIDKIYMSYRKERKERCKLFEDESQKKLLIDIEESTNIDEFRKRLIKLKKGTYLRDADIDTICSKITPREFIQNLIRYSVNHEKSKLKPIVDLTKIEFEKISALSDYLLEAYELVELFEMQYKVIPQDRPIIKYQLDDKSYASLSELSIGQKSTALLIMALSEGNIPIVIDQPEDSLDLKSVWDDVCQKLRKGKEKRQFILTTHNSSVAVASDTDNFIVLESDANSGQLKHSGAMDGEILGKEVIDYLEGGIETYKRKMKKYNISESD